MGALATFPREKQSFVEVKAIELRIKPHGTGDLMANRCEGILKPASTPTGAYVDRSTMGVYPIRGHSKYRCRRPAIFCRKAFTRRAASTIYILNPDRANN